MLEQVNGAWQEEKFIVIDFLFRTDDQSLAYEKERELIREIGLPNLTNLCHGGEGATRVETTTEHRLKISEALKRYYREHPMVRTTISEEQRAKISASLKGRPKGPDSAETRQRKSAAQTLRLVDGKRKGFTMSVEARQKVSEANKGKKLTEEHKQKIAASMKRHVSSVR
jgi:hypothetical protein